MPRATRSGTTLTVARAIEDSYSRAQALGRLAPHLPAELLSEALGRARPRRDVTTPAILDAALATYAARQDAMLSAWLELVAYLVAVVAAGSILASIYNSMNERRRQIALLRALGAHRRFVSASIILEAAAIACIGVLIAFFIYVAITSAAA